MIKRGAKRARQKEKGFWPDKTLRLSTLRRPESAAAIPAPGEAPADPLEIAAKDSGWYRIPPPFLPLRDIAIENLSPKRPISFKK